MTKSWFLYLKSVKGKNLVSAVNTYLSVEIQYVETEHLCKGMTVKVI